MINTNIYKRISNVTYLVLICAIAMTGTLNCNVDFFRKLAGEDTEAEIEERRMRNLLLAGLVLVSANPCNNKLSPVAGSAAPTSTSLAGIAGVRGRIVSQNGQAVVSALVTLEDSNLSDNVYYATHSGISRTGEFEIAGIPTGTNYRLALEPLNSIFSGRIDTHLDCFKSPANFTDGWFSGDGGTITTSSGAASGINLNTANQTLDLGTIRLIE